LTERVDRFVPAIAGARETRRRGAASSLVDGVRMIAAYRRPWLPSLVILFVLGCSNGSSSSGCGSGSSGSICTIETMATTCPGEITLECASGAKPDAKSQCVAAIKQDSQTLYCCRNDADLGGSDGGGGGR
jgi:hypothetical protein